MLKQLRDKKTAKWIWIGLGIIIIPAFVFWGFGSSMGEKKEFSFAGKIRGRMIPLTDYRDAYNAVKNQAVIQFGDNLPEIQKFMNFDDQAWTRLVLLAEARKKGIKAKDQEVIELVQKYPFFQHNGRFDERIYNQVTQYVFRTQPRSFEEQTRQNLILSKLYLLTTAEINVTEKEAKEEYRKNNEEISVQYITAHPAEIAKGLNPSDDEIKEYFTTNSFRFKQPRSFNIEYISLAAEEKDEKPVKNKIADIYRRLRGDQNLEKIAKELGLEAKKSGLFAESDPIPGIGWSPQILKLLAQAKSEQLLPAIGLDNKYFIIKVMEKKEPFVPEFETIKGKVRDTLIKEKSQEIAKNKIQDCLKSLKDSPDFEQAAKAAGIISGSTEAFKYGGYIEGVGATKDFWTAALNLKDGEFSQAIEMPSGYYIIKVKSRLPMDEAKFAKEKEAFSKKISEQKKDGYFTRFTEDLKQKAQKFY